MEQLEPEEQADIFFSRLNSNVLQSNDVVQAGNKEKDTTKKSSEFVLNKVGLAGESSSFFSALTILAGILGYALSSHIDNSIDIEREDYSILLDLLLVLGSILGFLVIMQIIRHFYNKYSSNLTFVGMFSNKSEELMGSTWHMNKSSVKGNSTHKKSQEGSFTNE